MTVTADHRHRLADERGIALDVITERGYLSLDHPDDVQDLGFSKAQARTAPVLAVALLLKLTLREPPRGFSDTTPLTTAEPPPFMDVVRNLWAKKSFRHLSFAAGLHAFVSYGISTFYSPFFIRSHGMSLSEVGAWLAVIVALGGMTGSFLGGAWCDRYYARTQDPRWYVWIPAITLIVCVPAAPGGWTGPVELFVWWDRG